MVGQNWQIIQVGENLWVKNLFSTNQTIPSASNGSAPAEIVEANTTTPTNGAAGGGSTFLG